MTRVDVTLTLHSGALPPIIEPESDVVAAVGRSATPPLLERTAKGNVDVAHWDRIVATDEFKVLLAAKLKFLRWATVCFIVYYFALLVLVGCARDFMETRVIGAVNLAYLFALSQFFMAGILAWLYFRTAARFDAMAKNILAKVRADH